MTSPVPPQPTGGGSIETGGRTHNSLKILIVDQTPLLSADSTTEQRRIVNRVLSRLPSGLKGAHLDFGPKGTLDLHNADTNSPSITGTYTGAPNRQLNIEAGDVYPSGSPIGVIFTEEINRSLGVKIPLGESLEAVTTIDRALDDFLLEGTAEGEPMTSRTPDADIHPASTGNLTRAGEPMTSRFTTSIEPSRGPGEEWEVK